MNFKHGYYGTPTYTNWKGMLYRCRSTDGIHGKYWRDRGITVCERWHKFENFLKDMGERPLNKSLDRINNDKGYSPKNCRWATPTEQARNTRNARTFKGKNLAQWAKILGVKRSTLAQRFYVYGWSVDRVLSK